MDELEKSKIGFYMEMYKENCNHARHHEIQRHSVTSSLVAISAAILSVIAIDKDINIFDLPLCIVLSSLGIIQIIFTLKIYERFRKHSDAAGSYRDEVERILQVRGEKNPRELANKKHESKFKSTKDIRLHFVWIILGVLIASNGVILCLYSIR